MTLAHKEEFERLEQNHKGKNFYEIFKVLKTEQSRQESNESEMDLDEMNLEEDENTGVGTSKKSSNDKLPTSQNFSSNPSYFNVPSQSQSNILMTLLELERMKAMMSQSSNINVFNGNLNFNYNYSNVNYANPFAFTRTSQKNTASDLYKLMAQLNFSPFTSVNLNLNNGINGTAGTNGGNNY